jgi:hypothetical protein
VTIDEVGIYTVENGKIVEERFFYLEAQPGIPSLENFAWESFVAWRMALTLTVSGTKERAGFTLPAAMSTAWSKVEQTLPQWSRRLDRSRSGRFGPGSLWLVASCHWCHCLSAAAPRCAVVCQWHRLHCPILPESSALVS